MACLLEADKSLKIIAAVQGYINSILPLSVFLTDFVSAIFLIDAYTMVRANNPKNIAMENRIKLYCSVQRK